MSEKECNELAKIMGNNMRRIRRLRKLSIEETARILNISVSYLGLIERGDRKFSLEKIFKFIEVFGVKFDDLIDGELIGSKIDKEYGKQIAALTSNFTEKEKEILMNMIKVVFCKS